MDSALNRYVVVFKDDAGREYAAEPLTALGDEAAVAHARTMYRMGIGAGYEIWHGDRLVHAVRFGK